MTTNESEEEFNAVREMRLSAHGPDCAVLIP